MIPFLDFPIGLRMFHPCQDMSDSIFGQESTECTFRFAIFIQLVGEKLRTMISENLSDPSDLTVVFQSFPNQSDAYLGGCYGEFPASKNESRAIIEHDTDLFAIDFAGTPVQVYKAQAVFSFIPDIGFPAFFLLGVFFSQTILEKNLMDGVMRYMLAVFVLDYYFEASCAGILLSVDASTVSKLSLMLISDISRIRRLSDSLMLIVGRPNFLGANGSLVFIQCPQTLLTVRMLTLIFISL
jgi:hypothetical protein